MGQFNTEMAKLRKEYNYHQLEWMARLRKILTLEKFSVDAKEQFANLLDKYFTQHLVEPADQDAEMEKVLNAQPDHEVMEVADDSQVLDSQPMRSDDEAASDPPSDAEQDSQVLDSQPMRSDDSASDPSSDAEPKSKKAKNEEP
ncbi:unnamed protein product [Cladocopium goreaui]|uniref:Uncharacterized protein n=1 Tax=Cladocopium goreaui TaxID=2562237 RepID=A0A9P1D051_9DINO|nr:unnamed protein product [Cladocopium goreaui]